MTLGDYIIIINIILICLDTQKCQDCLQHYLNELCVAFGKKRLVQDFIGSIYINFFFFFNPTKGLEP